MARCGSSTSPARSYCRTVAVPPPMRTSRPAAASNAHSGSVSMGSSVKWNAVPPSKVSDGRRWRVRTNTSLGYGGSSPHQPFQDSSCHGPRRGPNMLRPSGSGSGSSTSSKPVSQADIGKAMKAPTELTFWTWVPDIEQEVALFEKKYPAIKVKVANAGQGVPHYTKLRTALKAGSAAPDVVQIEYQAIPTFTITGRLPLPTGSAPSPA